MDNASPTLPHPQSRKGLGASDAVDAASVDASLTGRQTEEEHGSDSDSDSGDFADDHNSFTAILRQRDAKTQDEIAQLKQDLEAAQREAVRANKRADKLQDELDDADDHVEELEQELEELSAANSAAGSTAASVADGQLQQTELTIEMGAAGVIIGGDALEEEDGDHDDDTAAAAAAAAATANVVTPQDIIMRITDAQETQDKQNASKDPTELSYDPEATFPVSFKEFMHLLGPDGDVHVAGCLEKGALPTGEEICRDDFIPYLKQRADDVIAALCAFFTAADNQECLHAFVAEMACGDEADGSTRIRRPMRKTRGVMRFIPPHEIKCRPLEMKKFFFGIIRAISDALKNIDPPAGFDEEYHAARNAVADVWTELSRDKQDHTNSGKITQMLDALIPKKGQRFAGNRRIQQRPPTTFANKSVWPPPGGHGSAAAAAVTPVQQRAKPPAAQRAPVKDGASKSLFSDGGGPLQFALPPQPQFTRVPQQKMQQPPQQQMQRQQRRGIPTGHARAAPAGQRQMPPAGYGPQGPRPQQQWFGGPQGPPPQWQGGRPQPRRRQAPPPQWYGHPQGPPQYQRGPPQPPAQYPYGPPQQGPPAQWYGRPQRRQQFRGRRPQRPPPPADYQQYPSDGGWDAPHGNGWDDPELGWDQSML